MKRKMNFNFISNGFAVQKALTGIQSIGEKNVPIVMRPRSMRGDNRE